MNTWSKILFGVIPACVMTLIGLMFASFVSTTHQAILLGSGLIGTSGLIWSLTGYSREVSPAVLVMLCIGIIGIPDGGIGGAISALYSDAYNGKLGSPIELALRLLGVSWLTLGPALVGLLHFSRGEGASWKSLTVGSSLRALRVRLAKARRLYPRLSRSVVL